MLLGLVLSCGFITVRELFDDRVQDEDYLLQRYADIPRAGGDPRPEPDEARLLRIL